MISKSLTATGKTVTIAIRCPCNYRCHYCGGNNAWETTKLHSIERLREIYASLQALTVTFFECGASEPTLHPQIRDILELSLEHGAAYFPTNNSTRSEKWIPRTHVERMLVYASLHPQGEADINAYLDRLLRLRAQGAGVVVVFVAHPERLDKIAEYHDFFSSNQIKMQPVPLFGYYRGKKYPESYSDDQVSSLLKYSTNDIMPWVHSWHLPLVLEMPNRDFSGIPCIAGFRDLYIGDDDRIRRCVYDPTQLETRYDKAAPCKVRNCGCLLLLEELNTRDEEFWNYWRRFLGLEAPLNESDNYQTSFEEKKTKYWQLMERYGKLRKLAFDELEYEKVVFPHVLYDKKDTDFANSLERNFYGKRNSKGVLLLDDNGIVFDPSSKRDHLATRFIRVVPKSEGGGDVLRVTVSYAKIQNPKLNCIIYLQDKLLGEISGNILPSKVTDPIGEKKYVKHIEIDDDVSHFRAVIRTEDGLPTPVPNSVRIEQSGTLHQKKKTRERFTTLLEHLSPSNVNILSIGYHTR